MPDKNPKPQPKWAVRILTFDYLVEGFVETETSFRSLEYSVVSFPGGRHFYKDRARFSLASARIQPTGSLATPEFSVPLWMVETNITFVAFVPVDEASVSRVTKVWSGYDVPLRVVMYS